jgi:hypothetical protein
MQPLCRLHVTPLKKNSEENWQEEFFFMTMPQHKTGWENDHE